MKADASGLRLVPLTTRDHMRTGSRERIVDVAEKFPERLHVECHALVTRVLLDASQRATGVEYLKGERLYRAHPDSSDSSGEPCQARATREVILCGGAFNTPQLLMLSGIGPRAALSRSGIETRVDLAGVGKNLQDRYEVSVVNRMKEDWQMLAGAKFAKGDSQFHQWQTRKRGVYTTNGGLLAVVIQSKQERIPDLFCAALVGNFRGYFPGYSKLIAERQNYLSGSFSRRVRSTAPARLPCNPPIHGSRRASTSGISTKATMPGQGFRRCRGRNSFCPGDDQGFARTGADRRGGSAGRTISIRR